MTDVAVSECVDPAAGTFAAPASFDGGWPVGIDHGEDGLDVLETYLPLLSSVVPDPTLIRVAVVVTDELGGEQVLLTRDGTPGGPPILIELGGSIPEILEIPTLGDGGVIALALLLAGGAIVVLRRRGAGAAVVALLLAGGGLAWAVPGLAGPADDWLLEDRVAGNGVVLWAKQVGDQLRFRVDVDLLFDTAPTITSADATTFTVGSAGSFTVTADGLPAPAFTIGGDPLPGTLGFTDHGNGTATLAGTPGTGDLGTYALTFTADNGAGAPVVQSFTLSVILASYADFTLVSGHNFVIGIGAISFDSDGVYQDDFPLVGTAANTLAIDATGRLFTMTGAGGGEIYDAVSGSYLGDFAPSSVGEPSLGKPLLTVAGDTLFAYDSTTGFHAYDLSSL